MAELALGRLVLWEGASTQLKGARDNRQLGNHPHSRGYENRSLCKPSSPLVS